MGRPAAGERGRRPRLHAGQGRPPDRRPSRGPPRRGLVTLESDRARFTELDRDEAHERLPRLARTFALRLGAAGPDEWDRPRGSSWTLREIADDLTGVLWYAEQIGDQGRCDRGQ